MFEPLHVRKAEKVGQRRLCPHILIWPIRMKSVQTPARLRIDQRRSQIVLTQKPAEGTHRLLVPFCTVIRFPCCSTGRNRRGCLDGLLIEGLRVLAYRAEALSAYRPEVS